MQVLARRIQVLVTLLEMRPKPGMLGRMRFPAACILLLLALTGLAGAQTSKLKPLHELLPPGDTLQGTWWADSAQGREYFTFTGTGRVIMVNGLGQREELAYKVDAAAKPWKLDFVVSKQGVTGTIYSVFDFPDKDRLRFSRPVVDMEKRATAEELQKSGQLVRRLPWEPNAGLFQAVEAHLKSLEGTWQGLTNGSRGTLTFSKDGRYTVAEGSTKLSGRYRIDVTSVPCKMDLLPDDGTGPTYGLYEIKDGKLRISAGRKKAEERETKLETVVEFEK